MYRVAYPEKEEIQIEQLGKRELGPRAEHCEEA
jgi:hypothetical protein